MTETAAQILYTRCGPWEASNSSVHCLAPHLVRPVVAGWVTIWIYPLLVNSENFFKLHRECDISNLDKKETQRQTGSRVWISGDRCGEKAEQSDAIGQPVS